MRVTVNLIGPISQLWVFLLLMFIYITWANNDWWAKNMNFSSGINYSGWKQCFIVNNYWEKGLLLHLVVIKLLWPWCSSNRYKPTQFHWQPIRFNVSSANGLWGVMNYSMCFPLVWFVLTPWGHAHVANALKKKKEHWMWFYLDTSAPRWLVVITAAKILQLQSNLIVHFNSLWFSSKKLQWNVRVMKQERENVSVPGIFFIFKKGVTTAR